MIDRIGRRERHHVVAVLANRGRIDVRSVLTDSLNSVVAAEAIGRDAGVIEVRRCPRGCRMAIVAIVTAGDMRRVFARCRGAVVAGRAGANDVCVIDGPDRLPGRGTMTVLADVRCVYVARVFSGNVYIVVATKAVPADVGVVEDGWNP